MKSGNYLLPFVPLLPGETAYSWIVRVIIRIAYPCIRNAIKQCIGREDLKLNSMFPAYLKQISNNTKDSMQLIVSQHTVAPLFKSFVSQQFYQCLLSRLELGDVQHLHTQLSIVANRLTPADFLYSCNCCVNEDERLYGEAYWHIEHQLPGMTKCFRHNRPLSKWSIKRRDIQLPRSLNQNEMLCDSVESEKMNLMLYDAWCNPVSISDEKVLQNFYLDRLRTRNLVTNNGTIKQELLRGELHAYWLGVLDERAFSFAIGDNCKIAYPANMFYQKRCRFHPLKHLLIIGYLFENWLSFKSAIEFESKKLAQRSSVKKAFPIKQDDDSSDTILKYLRKGISLREVAKMTGHSVSFIKKVAVQNKIPMQARAQRLFETERNQIILLLRKGLSTSDIANQFDCSVGAIEQILAQNPDVVSVRKKLRFEKIKQQHRKRVCRQLAKDVTQSRSQIQKAERSSYTWLYKNDTNWLYSQLPAEIPREVRYKRIH